MQRHQRMTTVLFALLFTFSCAENDIAPDEIDECEDYSGIVRTLVNGTILGDGDPGDWVPRCSTSEVDFCASPAYPNPAASSIALIFSIGQTTRIQIWVEDRCGDMVESVNNDFLTAGVYNFQLNLEAYDEGIYRVHYRALNDQDEVIFETFGDIMVER